MGRPARLLAPLLGPRRFAYGEGTSFAAPFASGLAALVWQVQPRLASEQVADVLIRTARQTVGRRNGTSSPGRAWWTVPRPRRSRGSTT